MKYKFLIVIFKLKYYWTKFYFDLISRVSNIYDALMRLMFAVEAKQFDRNMHWVMLDKKNKFQIYVTIISYVMKVKHSSEP